LSESEPAEWKDDGLWRCAPNPSYELRTATCKSITAAHRFRRAAVISPTGRLKAYT